MKLSFVSVQIKRPTVLLSIVFGTALASLGCSAVKFTTNGANGLVAATGGLGSSSSGTSGSSSGTSGSSSGTSGSSSGTSGSSSGTSGSSSGSCNLQNVTIPIKIMFVVDTSGSNAYATQEEGTVACDPTSGFICDPATDPNKTFRYGSIQTFFSDYQAKTNFSWGFEVFSGISAQSYINSGSGAASFGNAAAMVSAMSTFYNETDYDATPYLAALNSAQTAIANDPDLYSTAPNPPLYYVVFMSDGYPTDALNPDNSVNLPLINSTIANLLALAPNRISLSTVYYGTINDPVAAGTLQSMSQAGNGQFVNVDTGSTSSISIDDLIQVPVGQCY